MEATSGRDCTLDDVIDDIENAIFSDEFGLNFEIYAKILKIRGLKPIIPKQTFKPKANKKQIMIEDDLDL